MVKVIQQGDTYIISFRYNAELIDLVKNVPGRRYDPSSKTWSIPSQNLGMFLNEVKGTQFEDLLAVQSNEQLNINASIDVTDRIPDIDISGIHYYVKEGAEPFAHQLDFMKYAVPRNNSSGFILADEQGLGKTSEIMNLALYRRYTQGYKHCLIIVCLNGAKYNWVNDIHTHTKGAEVPYILGSRVLTRGPRKGKIREGGSQEKLEDLRTGHMYGDTSRPKLPYFLVTNIESVRMKSVRKYPIVEQIVKMVNDGHLDMIPIDEVHRNMSPTSIQGKCILKIKQLTGNKVEWVPMTGTPIVNKPTDVYAPLKLVDGHTFKDYWSWCQHFCVYGGFGNHDILGYKNIPQLKQMLQSNMLRRLKKDVYDLPPKIYYPEYVINTPYQDKLYRDVQIQLRQKKEDILQSMNPMVQFLKLRQVNGSPELVDPELQVDKDYIKKNAKLHRLIELIEEIHERDEKVIIYSNWVEPLRMIYKFISKKYGVCVYTGSNVKDREEHKQRFIDSTEHTIMMGTIAALGTSHTLTVARNIIFYDDPWNEATKIQAEDRAHRPGTTHSVNIYTLIAKDTIDEVVDGIVYSKGDMANYIVDGILDMRGNSKLFDQLIA